jgi:hypothetical protein
MFSLIITVISIALVAALALATLYYGGSAFNKGSAAAQSTQLLNESQQLLGAAELFYADNHRWPESVSEMVSLKYLNFPVAINSGVVNNALAANDWLMVAPGQPVFVTASPSTATCQSVNQRAYGLDGVLADARAQLVSQCFGEPTAGTLQVLVSRSSAQLMAAVAQPTSLISASLITQAAIPAADDFGAWALAPDTLAEATVVAPPPATVGTPALDVSPASLTFGNVATNTSKLKTFVLTNTGDGLLTFSSAGLTGNTAYSQESSTCAGTLVPAASCSVTVRFAPTVIGEALESYDLVSDAPNSPQTIALSSLAFNPVSLTAGALPGALLNELYGPFEFSSFLAVSNEASPDKSLAVWGEPAGIPAGMSFDKTTGTLSGTPSAVTSGAGASFEVIATYKDNRGNRSTPSRWAEQCFG